jgi:hypothetical protein
MNYSNHTNIDTETALDELADHARDDADLFAQMAAWLRELLNEEGRP